MSTSEQGASGARSERDEIHPGGDEGHDAQAIRDDVARGAPERFGFDRLNDAQLCELADKYLGEREAAKQAVFVLALIDHLSRRLKRQDAVMTDYLLANELMTTLEFLMGLHPVEEKHAERIRRAIRFLRGERESAGVTDEELGTLLRNDPTVAAIFNAARAQAHRDIEIAAHRDKVRAEMEIAGAVPASVPADGQLPEGATVVSPMCASCLSTLVHKSLLAKPEDPWRAWVVMVQMLLVSVVMEDPEAEKLGGAQDLQGTLLAIGCLGCRYPRALHHAGLLIRLRGTEFVGRVLKGEAKAISFDVKALARRRQ